MASKFLQNYALLKKVANHKADHLHFVYTLSFSKFFSRLKDQLPREYRK